MTERLKWSLRWRLSSLWILQWGITGAIFTYLPLYFEQNSLRLDDIGPLLATGAIGLWVAPLVVGQICDRWMAVERYLSLAHFVGGVTLLSIPLAVSIYSETQDNYYVILVLFGLYAAAYIPTVPLASALTFRHLTEPKRQFGGVRVWGTVGWVLAGVGLSLWLERADVDRWLRGRYPEWSGQLDQFAAAFHWVPAPTGAHSFYIAALLSFALSSFCVFLPHTPAARKPRNRIALLQLLGLFRQRAFVQLMIASCLLAMVIPLYTLVVPLLLRDLHVAGDWVPAVMTVGQVSEFPALLLMPLFLRRLGLKWTFGIGIAAWLVRYLTFAVEPSFAWVLAGVSLHGICHVFLIVVIQIYLDAECPADLRNSVQNMFLFLALGVATPLGFLASRPLVQWATVTTAEGDLQTSFAAIFLAASFALTAMLLAFWWWFDPHPGADHEDVGVRTAGDGFREEAEGLRGESV